MKNNTAVIIVDMQDFFLKNFKSDIRNKLIANQIKVIDFYLKNKTPFVLLEYRCRGIFRGKVIKEIDQRIKGVNREYIVKENNSGFTNTKLDEILKKWGIRNIVLMGINANGCVQDTAIGAIHRGYKVLTSFDIIASSSRADFSLSPQNKKWYQKNIGLM